MSGRNRHRHPATPPTPGPPPLPPKTKRPPPPRATSASLLDQLIADYANEDRGLEIREVAGGFRLATKPEYHDAVRGFVKHLKPPLKLSLQALETLAVVAYKQPVTAPEISEIRGVESAGTCSAPSWPASSSPPPAASRSSAAPSSTKPPRTSSSASASKTSTSSPASKSLRSSPAS